ncbi:alginate lyase family protein [Neiella sp. HB171785]|uniref:Alginate lyase family protein n=1 Tax=Neiella litorisoli TaxID=2771431 RepID=A0A8J6QP06_9GAMM|nr:alginate lyase family protein [Neiella litorisoli]
MALIEEADAALESAIDPVTNKTLLPASGDPHDYFSFGPYWWPNPDTEDGLPYVKRDGDYNMATKTAATDKMRMIRLAKEVKALGLAYYFSEDPKYAEKAKAQLRAWYINPATRMNPNMNHAQAIPGLVDGRGIGIIDSRLLIGVIDSVELIRPTLTDEEYNAIVQWFAELKHWMLTSKNGQEEDAYFNNHGTWFDAQVVAIAIFVGDIEEAKTRLRNITTGRIQAHFDAHGEQEEELSRTRPWHYVNFNLEAYSLLGRYADVLGVDLWNFKAGDISLEQGYRFVADYAATGKAWPYKEKGGYKPYQAYGNLMYANKAYGTAIYSDAIEALLQFEKAQEDIHNLLF